MYNYANSYTTWSRNAKQTLNKQVIATDDLFDDLLSHLFVPYLQLGTLYTLPARTRECGAGLAALRVDHLTILADLSKQGVGQEAAFQDRIAAVTNRKGDTCSLIQSAGLLCRGIYV